MRKALHRTIIGPSTPTRGERRAAARKEKRILRKQRRPAKEQSQ